MASEERQTLLDEANALGLEFAGNISNAKLQAMVDEAQSPAVKEDTQDTPVPEAVNVPTSTTANKQQRLRAHVAKMKRAAMVKRIVTITNKDNRDNDVTTTATLSVENQFFSIGRIVPLDVPVELEQALIDVAESSIITLHKDEIVEGKRTGNKVAVPTKRYVVSYEDIKNQE